MLTVIPSGERKAIEGLEVLLLLFKSNPVFWMITQGQNKEIKRKQNGKLASPHENLQFQCSVVHRCNRIVPPTLMRWTTIALVELLQVSVLQKVLHKLQLWLVNAIINTNKAEQRVKHGGERYV